MPAHPHAELMALYAKDAAETDKPWERWEWFDPFLNQWSSLNSFPSWAPRIKYRRKPERSWYRVALMKTEENINYTFSADSKSVLKTGQTGGYPENAVEGHPNFVKWLTDRVYYDAE